MIVEVRCVCPHCDEEFEEEVEIDPGDFANDRDWKREKN